MSTILQALQRAEADRGRGQVPGLHAAPVAPLSPAGGSQHAPSSHPAALRSPWVWLGAGAVLLVGGLLTWVGLLRPPGLAVPPLAAPTPAVAAAGAAPTIDDKNVPLAQYPIASSASDSIAKKPSSPAPLAALPPPEARTGGKTPVARVAAPASEATPTAPTAAPTAIATAAASAPLAAATAAPAVAVVVPLAEATDEMRRLVPTLAISGAVHSNERSQRMVIANGQVLHEGDAWGSDAVVIDEIRPRSVVLKVRGQRVMLPL